MVAFTKKVLLLVLGWSFIFLGIIGLFLPFLQGILFMLIGLVILSKESKTAKYYLHKLKEKHPAPFRSLTRLRRQFSVRFNRLVGR